MQSVLLIDRRGIVNFASLIKWFQGRRLSRAEKAIQTDPLLALYGSGKSLWADEHADEYVARLRAGWE
jgi:hypothetical protein